MILQYVLISWSRKDGTSWYAITTFVLNQQQCSFGVLACMNDKCVCVSVCVPQSAVNSVMPQDFSSIDASASSRYVCMCNLYGVREIQSENQTVSKDIDPLLPCKSSSGLMVRAFD